MHDHFQNASPAVVCVVAVIMITYLTEITSNAATATIFVPVLLALVGGQVVFLIVTISQIGTVFLYLSTHANSR